MSPICLWLMTLALHAAILLLLAWAIDTALPSLRGSWRESLWRSALFGALLTASVQVAAPAQSVVSRWHWAAAMVAMPQSPAARTSDATSGSVPVAGSAAHVASSGSKPPAGRTFIQSPAPTDAPAQLVASSPGEVLAVLLPLAWLAGALLALARFVAGWLALRRELACAVPVTDADIEEDLSALAARAGSAVPRLLRLDALPGPIAATGARIVLPDWALARLGREQLRAMLAHELGHVVRGDAAWKLLAAAWHAVLWFMPLAGLARRRLDEIAELACDAFAAQQTGDERSLAECLATCAEHHVHGGALQLAPAMAARPSALLRRIERLLEGVSMDTNSSRAWPRTIAALALAGAVFCLPVVGVDSARAQPPDAAAAKPGASTHSSVSIHSDDDGSDTMTISVSGDGHKFSAKVEGKIAFNDDETDVVGIGGSGTATFEESAGGVSRRLEIVDHGGKLERRYFVDRQERPLDDEGRKWTTSIVLQLVRSGIGAEQRVARLYSRGGAPRVLDEIAQIPTDYVRGVYLRALVNLGKLTPAEVDRAVKLAGDLSSDYERRQALTAIFVKQALDPSEQVTFLRQALRFDSDYERAELLVESAPKLANTPEVRQAWLDAALKLGSDYERRRALQTLLARQGLDAAQVAAVIEASTSMTSDYEHRELLVAAAKQLRDPEPIAVAYARSTQKIASDYERREALIALLQSGRIGKPGANAVLESAAQINSSYERRELLVALARVMPDDVALQNRYRDVAASLSAYDRSEAERALLR